MPRKGLLREHATTVDMIHRSLDLLGVIAGALAAYLWRFGDLDLPPAYKSAVVLATIAAFVAFRWFGLYQSWRGMRLTAEIQRLTAAWGAVFVALASLAFLLKLGAAYSRLWAGAWWVGTWALLVGLRVTTRLALRWLCSGGGNQRRIVLVGATELSARVIRQLRELPWAGYRVVGVFDEPARAPAAGVFEGVAVWGDLGDVARYAEDGRFDQVWLCLPLREAESMEQVLNSLATSSVEIRFVPDIFGFNLLNHSLTEVAGLPVINLAASPMTGWNRFLKAVEDRVLAAAILILISPLMLIIALAVKLTSPGPILYRQERVGWNGRPFMMLKFRTMVVDAERDGVRWGGARDKRLTPIGGLLRRTSLDELPQFINVLRGEMSIVGPRPERPMFVRKFREEIPGYMKKHMVKAGITGWAQVNGWRGDTDLQARIEHDLYYIEHWSVWFDLKIIFLTLFKGFVNKNAY